MKLGTQIWGVITVVVVGGLVAGGWFLGAAPLLDAKAKADQSRTQIATQNALISAQITALEAKRAEMPDLEIRAAELEGAIPSEVGGGDFIRGLNDLATANGATIKSIAISNGSTYQPPAPGEDLDGAPVPLTNSLITAENFVLVPVSVSVEGGWNELLAFVHAMQTGKRLVLVTSLSSSTIDGHYQFQIFGTMYALQRHDGPEIDTTVDTSDTEADTADATAG
jgi:Tfp pilus assembly protein PilO